MKKIEIKRHGKAMPYEVTLEGPGTAMKCGSYNADVTGLAPKGD